MVEAEKARIEEPGKQYSAVLSLHDTSLEVTQHALESFIYPQVGVLGVRASAKDFYDFEKPEEYYEWLSTQEIIPAAVTYEYAPVTAKFRPTAIRPETGFEFSDVVRMKGRFARVEFLLPAPKKFGESRERGIEGILRAFAPTKLREQYQHLVGEGYIPDDSVFIVDGDYHSFTLKFKPHMRISIHTNLQENYSIILQRTKRANPEKVEEWINWLNKVQSLEPDLVSPAPGNMI